MKVYTVVRFWSDLNEDGEIVDILHYMATFSNMDKVNEFLDKITKLYLKDQKAIDIAIKNDVIKHNKEKGTLDIKWDCYVDAFRTIENELDVYNLEELEEKPTVRTDPYGDRPEETEEIEDVKDLTNKE